MARSSGLATKFSRREGADLFLKSMGVKSKKSDKKPGQHGGRPPRLSNYGVQLREKQKTKRIYGVSERQFHNYYLKAASKKGSTGVLLLQFLEARLDNIVYRAGFAVTRAEARQMVSHGAILVDGKKVNVASYQVKAGATISLTEAASLQKRIENALNHFRERSEVSWIETNLQNKSALVKYLPDRGDLPADYNEHLIVELYSK